MAHVGYIRVSSVQQNNERQLEGVALDKVFTETASGKNADRPQLKAMIDYVREGDVIHCHSIDRLGRNTKDLLSLVEELTAKGVIVQFHKEGLSTDQSNPFSKMMFTVFAGIATMEREYMLMKQSEGYAAAKAAGRIAGRGKGKDVDRAAIVADIMSQKSIRLTAKDNNVSVSTVQRIKKELEQ